MSSASCRNGESLHRNEENISAGGNAASKINGGGMARRLIGGINNKCSNGGKIIIIINVASSAAAKRRKRMCSNSVTSLCACGGSVSVSNRNNANEKKIAIRKHHQRGSVMSAGVMWHLAINSGAMASSCVAVAGSISIISNRHQQRQRQPAAAAWLSAYQQ